MATLTTIVDDLDGQSDAETVSFSLENISYDIDLSTANKLKLREALAPFVAHARIHPDAGPKRVRARRSRSAGASTIAASTTVSEELPAVVTEPVAANSSTADAATKPTSKRAAAKKTASKAAKRTAKRTATKAVEKAVEKAAPRTSRAKKTPAKKAARRARTSSTVAAAKKATATATTAAPAPVGKSGQSGKVVKTTPGLDVSPTAVRAWAKAHHVPISTRGRLPRSVVDRFLSEQH